MSPQPLHNEQPLIPAASDSSNAEILYQGKFLAFQKKGSWEFVSRCHVSGTVGILAITENREIILVEQFRPPMNRSVIEIPAGLVGDVPNQELETLAEAAIRELLEETGYGAESMEFLTDGPSSAGLSTEVISFFLARGPKKISEGGGDGSENITVHLVPLNELTAWLDYKRREGCMVDYKIFAALYLGMLMEDQ